MCVAAMFSYAQNKTVDNVLNYDETFVIFEGTSSDVLESGDSTWMYTIQKKTDEKVFAYFFIDLDSVGGTAADVNIYLQRKVFGSESYSNVDTVTYAGTTDTTFVIKTTSADWGDYWRINIVGSNDEFEIKINELNAKFLK